LSCVTAFETTNVGLASVTSVPGTGLSISGGDTPVVGAGYGVGVDGEKPLELEDDAGSALGSVSSSEVLDVGRSSLMRPQPAVIKQKPSTTMSLCRDRRR
jgi:hypothetical protein